MKEKIFHRFISKYLFVSATSAPPQKKLSFTLDKSLVGQLSPGRKPPWTTVSLDIWISRLIDVQFHPVNHINILIVLK